MTDYTAEVVRLEAAYDRMKAEREDIRAAIRREYKKKMQEAIDEALKESEYRFAREIAEASARGVPGSVIRENVLRTQDWGRWKKWRDLAEIPPERVAIKNAKEEQLRANLPYREQAGVWYAIRDAEGNEIEPFEIEYIPATGAIWPAEGLDYSLVSAAFGDLVTMRDVIRAGMEKAGDWKRFTESFKEDENV